MRIDAESKCQLADLLTASFESKPAPGPRRTWSTWEHVNPQRPIQRCVVDGLPISADSCSVSDIGIALNAGGGPSDCTVEAEIRRNYCIVAVFGGSTIWWTHPGRVRSVEVLCAGCACSRYGHSTAASTLLIARSASHRGGPARSDVLPGHAAERAPRVVAHSSASRRAPRRSAESVVADIPRSPWRDIHPAAAMEAKPESEAIRQRHFSSTASPGLIAVAASSHHVARHPVAPVRCGIEPDIVGTAFDASRPP